jgi:hypothetical protein
MTAAELKRLSGAVHFMELHCQPRRGDGLWWVSTNKNSDRHTIAALQKQITKLQWSMYHRRPYNVTTFETRGGLHAHLVFIGNPDMAERLKASKRFGKIIHVDPVTDPHALARKYLAKERTPQAGYGRKHVLGGRIRGSHQLEGGGDRVRLSRDLERDAISEGYIEPWQHTYARRSTYRKDYRPRQLKRRAPQPSGQLPLLPEIDRPVSRLSQFGGGKVPPAVALEMEHRRRQLGLSQRELAARVGISQGQYANAIRGHDPLAAFAVNRLRDESFRNSN